MTMTAREPTDADLESLVTFTRTELDRLGITHDATVERYRHMLATGYRVFVLFDDNQPVAQLSVVNCETADGPGVQVVSVLVDRDHPDRLDLLDRVTLFALNAVITANRIRIVGRRRYGLKGAFYGRDHLGMEAAEEKSTVTLTGDATQMREAIFARHPDWQAAPNG